MKKKSILLVMALLFSIVSVAGIIADRLEGAWVFNIEQTLPEYSKGKVIFEKGEEEGYTGRIEFDTGRMITLSSVDVEADTLTFNVYVDGYLVTTTCTIEGDELKGFVLTPDGKLPFLSSKEE